MKRRQTLILGLGIAAICLSLQKASNPSLKLTKKSPSFGLMASRAMASLDFNMRELNLIKEVSRKINRWIPNPKSH